MKTMRRNNLTRLMKKKNFARFPKWIATKEYIEEGGKIPKGYAVSHKDFLIQAQICYPIGLHLIVRWSRDLLFWLSKVGYPGYRQRVVRRIYWDGVEEGIRRSKPPLGKRPW